MNPKETISEERVRTLNSNVFLKEFTFSTSLVKGEDKQEYELADNIVWLDDIVFLIQIKERDLSKVIDEISENKWFNKKVIQVAKSQMKDTINFIKKYSNKEILNHRSNSISMKNININKSKRIIIYAPSDKLSLESRFRKFYLSSEIGKIHLFHIEDYRGVCIYLVTPTEINEYLDFREDMLEIYGKQIDRLSEQVILGHFLSERPLDTLSIQSLDYFKKFSIEEDSFNLSNLLYHFKDRLLPDSSTSSDYQYIVKEIAKLNRLELKEIKERIKLIMNRVKDNVFEVPYRVVFPRTECGFVFIPITKEQKDNWKSILENFTLAHKYDQKIDKCIGVIAFKETVGDDFIDFYWSYAEFPWEHDESLSSLLKEYFPFRSVSKKQVGSKY